MKNQHPYIPILLWKQAEKGAIKALKEDEKTKIAPLFQLIPKFTPSKDNPRELIPIPREAVLNDALEYIHKYLNGFKLFLDSSLLYLSDRNEALSRMNDSSDLFGNNIIPVLTISDIKEASFDQKVKKFIKEQGICLRVNIDEINNGFLNEIDSVINSIGINRGNVDFLVDCKITNPNSFDSLVNFIKRDGKINEWRSYYIASGAFRENLIGLSPGVHDQARLDWALWNKLHKELINLRDIGFSDYTIQYPIYTPVNTPNTSFSVRYAKEDVWKIMKGQARNARKNAGDLQYYAHSKMLIDLGLFCGENCCNGDQYIFNLSKNSNQSRGNSTTWLRVGVNHHIALTLQQIDKMN